ncbi:hypothetical protein [Thiohalomonas denitrificans]|uniref:hypothetical protein n=1 Tax=Thiohalomonas denitrificans TaxID=415747 RepID=UPI001586BA00|nr:hypothetical protein [Thiohalomonas denitrificans]
MSNRKLVLLMMLLISGMAISTITRTAQSSPSSGAGCAAAPIDYAVQQPATARR